MSMLCGQCNQSLRLMFRGRQAGIFHENIEDDVKCWGEDFYENIEDDVKCWGEDDDDVVGDEEMAQLQARYAKRVACWEAVKPFMLNAVSGERAKGKGSRNRKWFVGFLGSLCRVYRTVEDEGFHVKEFGHGPWDKKFLKCFNAEEQDLIRRTIAPGMGAFCGN